jgi:acetylornithine deacetylase
MTGPSTDQRTDMDELDKAMVPDSQLVGFVRDWVAAHDEEIVTLVQELVRIPSETHPPGGDEGEAQTFVAQHMTDLGLDVDVFEPWHVPDIGQHPGWWPGLEYENRPNVVGTYKGDGSGRSLIVNGHIDVVPAGPAEEWTSPPYGAEVRNGSIYGRGSVDMKGGIATMLAAMRCLLDGDWRPGGDVILESVVNEELGGYNGTLACCVRGYAADAAILTECTDFQITTATKGGQVYRALVPGVAVHSCFWWKGVSAFDNAIKFKQALHEFEEERARETRHNPYFTDPALHPKAAWADNIWFARAGDPAIMAHPAEAELHFWVEHLPGEDREALLERFERYVADFCDQDPFLRDHPIRLERSVMRPFTGVGIDPNHDVIGVLRGAHVAVRGHEPIVAGFPAASDSMIFNLWSDTPAVNFGAGDAVAGRAHAPDEHVSINDVLDATATLAIAIATFCGRRADG